MLVKKFVSVIFFVCYSNGQPPGYKEYLASELDTVWPQLMNALGEGEIEILEVVPANLIRETKSADVGSAPSAETAQSSLRYLPPALGMFSERTSFVEEEPKTVTQESTVEENPKESPESIPEAKAETETQVAGGEGKPIEENEPKSKEPEESKLEEVPEDVSLLGSGNDGEGKVGKADEVGKDEQEETEKDEQKETEKDEQKEDQKVPTNEDQGTTEQEEVPESVSRLGNGSDSTDEIEKETKTVDDSKKDGAPITANGKETQKEDQKVPTDEDQSNSQPEAPENVSRSGTENEEADKAPTNEEQGVSQPEEVPESVSRLGNGDEDQNVVKIGGDYSTPSSHESVNYFYTSGQSFTSAPNFGPQNTYLPAL